MKFYNTPDEDKQFLWNEAKKGDRVAKRMLNAYRKRKRQKKIEKLLDRTGGSDELWKGLE
jgi:transposase